jgi:hypothetical protein
MPLLTDELRTRLPPLYSQEAEPEPYIHARFTLPGTTCAWYVMEGEAKGGDFLFFGYVCGQESEFGYFLLSELESARTPLGAAVERDLTFTEGRLTDVVPAPDT